MMRVFGTVSLVALLVVLAAAGIGAWAWHDVHTIVDHPGSRRNVEIARGDRLDQILQKLQQQGIIDQTLPLRLYIKIKKSDPVIQAGSYTFPNPISPIGVLEILQKGASYEHLTVIEGWSRFDIADAMMRIPTFQLTDRQQAIRLFDDVSLIKDLDPHATNLEGYLFPDTYFVSAETPPKELVKQMVSRFREVWSKGLQQRAKLIGRDTHSVITEASIIETEAKLKSERPIIASVVENRLKRKISLSMDSTVIYASKLAGAWKNDGKVYQSDIDRDSPYNTRRYKGLPPGPIASPGKSSIEAAVRPASTNYIYYVRNPDRNDGAHNFYADAQQFEKGVQALRAWERKHPAARR